MKKILFVCHGNICRSPMAEFVMKDLVKKHGLEASFYIASAATSREEIGNPVYPPVRKLLGALGISCEGKKAIQLTAHDYDLYDYIIAMDDMNLRNIDRIITSNPDDKISRLLDFTDTPGNIADPWYTDDFETTYRDVLKGCEGLLKYIESDMK